VYSILHISDLHRSTEEPLSNNSLLALLLRDRDRYTADLLTPIPAPEAIIVSGDIIQGALLGAPSWSVEVAAQYRVAEELLVALADRFLDGDRSRLVMTPGNHDVCWNTARAAMTEVTASDEPTSVLSAIADPRSDYRWDWKTKGLFRIADRDQYRRRLDAYWDFVDRFYRGASLTFPIVRDRGFNLFELARGAILVAAFDSVHDNDCFSFCGSFKEGVVGACDLLLRDHGDLYTLKIATWHHSLHGPPMANDYLDLSCAHELVGYGYRLAFHGHQHLPQISVHSINLPDEHMMGVISAGSLCAGARDMPRGQNRQYNVVTVSDDYTTVDVYAREITDGGHFAPRKRGVFCPDGKATIRFPALPGSSAELQAVRRCEALILRAESIFRAGQPETALRLLERVPRPPGSHARRLYLEAAQGCSNWDAIVTFLGEPQTADELTYLVHAFASKKCPGEALEALKHADRVGLPPVVRRLLESEVQTRAAMRSGS